MNTHLNSQQQNQVKKITQAIPTNIITGFLGVGKTTLILELLKQKPENETWAVLVNEFGEVGIDGSILANAAINQEQVSIREVPGGCMCCTSGLPMQIALSQLIARSNPSRLLIEPTGLGHPKEVIQTLSQAHYNSTIDLRATITLVDPRKTSQSRYTEHEIYRQQIEVADVIVATKSDLCSTDDRDSLKQYLDILGKDSSTVVYAEFGKLDLACLDINLKPGQIARSEENYKDLHEHNSNPSPAEAHATTHRSQQGTPQKVLPSSPQQPLAEDEEELMIRKENQGKGYFSCGWIFDPEITFDYKKLRLFFSNVKTERCKAIAITEAGVFGFNQEDQQLSMQELDDCMDSRLEIISIQKEDWDSLESQLLACCDYLHEV